MIGTGIKLPGQRRLPPDRRQPTKLSRAEPLAGLYPALA
jgi:hypothetical protein